MFDSNDHMRSFHARVWAIATSNKRTPMTKADTFTNAHIKGVIARVGIDSSAITLHVFYMYDCVLLYMLFIYLI